MKKLLFVLLSVGVLLLGFFLAVVSLFYRTTEATVGPTPLQVAVPKVESPKVESEVELAAAPPSDESRQPGETVAAKLPDAELRAAVAALDGARTVGVWSSAEKRLVRGRVELPAGLPPDPTLTVLAFRAKPSPESVYGRFGALSRYARDRRGIDSAAEDKAERERREADDGSPVRADSEEPPESPIVEPGAAPRAEPPADEEEEPDPHLHGMIAVAPVAADGGFEIPFPAGVDSGWLAIDGRFLYSEELEPVALTAQPEPVLTPKIGAWLTGEVRLPHDLANLEAVLRDLRVTLAEDPSAFRFVGVDLRQRFQRLAVPDDAGRFEFRGVPTAPTYVVTASSADLADATSSGITLKDARDEHLVIRMVYGARVSGRVLDESGAPVAEARVKAATGELFGFATNDVGRARTDAQGRFEFPHLPPGKVQVLARLGGYLDSRPMRLELEDLEVRDGVQLELSRGERVAGVVKLPDGSPAGGVTVNLGFDPDALGSMAAFNAARGADGKAITKPDGTFEITGLGRGPFAVRAVGAVDGLGHAARIAPVKPGTVDLELQLRPDPVVAGVVITANGEPIEKFQVRAEFEAIAFWAGGHSIERSFEDPAGAFRITDLRQGKWKLRAAASGWATSEWRHVELPLDEGAPPVELVLYPEAVTEGVVLDPEGNAISGAMVRQDLDLMQTIANAAGADEFGAARTDEEGRFRLGGLPAGGVALVASHADHVDSAPISVDVDAGRTTRDITLRLRIGGVLTGEIFDSEGEPAGGAMIVLQETANFQPTTLRSEPDGTFRRESVKPGRYQVTAMLSDIVADQLFSDDEQEPDWGSFLSNMKTDVVDVKEGEATHVVLGAPPADPVRVTGTVRNGGAPVGKAMVAMYPEGTGGIGAMKFTSTDDEGDFELLLDHPGNYMLQVQILGAATMAQDAMEFPQVVPEGEEHRIDVDLPGGRFSGRVTDRDGRPLPNTRVSLTIDGGVGLGSFLGKRYVETRTDEDGRYEVNYLDPEVYAISVGGTIAGGAFGGTADAGRVVRGGIVLDEGEWIQGVDFRLGKPGEITGRVVDVTGSLVNGVSIFVRDERGYVLERFSLCTTDGNGRFRYSGVAPGRYTVSARTADLASLESRAVVVPEGGVGETEITVEAATTLNVSVVDQAGNVADPKILVTDEDGRQVNGMISYSEIMSADSRLYSPEEQAVGPLPPGNYTVTARAPDGRTVTKPVTLSGQAERRLKLRLK